MPRSLSGKLALTLLALLALLGGFYVALAVLMSRLHVQEVTQRLNERLATGIVNDKALMLGERINQAALEETFHMLMVINPSIEVYLVDPDGEILAFSAPPGEVERTRIALSPVRAFLGGKADYPLLGDDPRDRAGRKIFSAAPIRSDGRLTGYLYIVLAGEHYDSVAELFEASYVLRLSAGIAGGGLLLALGAGLLSFRWLTRRLRRLNAAMEAFTRGDYQEPVRLENWRRDRRSDEIDQLGTAFEQLSRRIVEQVRELRQADAGRRELVVQVSHDLRTPLASLQGYLETMLIKQHALSYSQSRQQLEMALRHCRRLGRLIDELFELATLEGRDAELHIEAFPPGELVQDVALKFRLEAEKKSLGLETEMPEHAPFVRADIARIERVLDNLIDNAIKYTPPGGTVRVAVTPLDGEVEISVADTGPGIREADLPHIFQRFYRAAGRAQPSVEGAGLGLAIARRILELHGTVIDVTSRPGEGTVFAFRLPVAEMTSHERAVADDHAMPA